MSLLKKAIEANPLRGTREVHYVTLHNIVPAAPAVVNGEPKAKVCITIADGEGTKMNMYLFKDSIAGYPNYIPEGGVKAMITLQESEDKQYVNAVALGVGA